MAYDGMTNALLYPQGGGGIHGPSRATAARDPFGPTIGQSIRGAVVNNMGTIMGAMSPVFGGAMLGAQFNPAPRTYGNVTDNMPSTVDQMNAGLGIDKAKEKEIEAAHIGFGTYGGFGAASGGGSAGGQNAGGANGGQGGQNGRGGHDR